MTAATMQGPALAISLGDFLDPSFLVGVGVLAGIYAIFALGLQLNVGFTGVVNFGQAGFMAVGAYAMAILAVDASLPLPIAFLLAAVITMGFGLLVGLPSVRLRADYLAIATIAAAEIVRLFANNLRELTGGNLGFACTDDQSFCYYDPWRESVEEPIEEAVTFVLGTDIDTSFPLFLIIWIVVLVLTAALYFAQRTPWGRVLRAVREDEDAARALGKNTFAYKLQSLAISALIATIAGFFLAMRESTISPLLFEPLVTFIGFAVLLLGGLANYWGVAVGSLIMWFLIEGTRNLDLPITAEQEAALRFIVVGVVLILLMAFRPQGIFGKREEMVLGD
jgi:branched-chain amino acid transport system permease protein